MPRSERPCARCGRTIRLIYGRCPNCGAVNDGSQLRATTPSPEGGFQTDLDDLLVLVGLLTPAAAVILLVILDVLPGLAVLIAAVLTLAAIGRAVL